MPALWYHTGPLAGKIRAVDADTARRDVAAGIAQDMRRPGGPLKRANYATRDMRAAPAPAPEPAPTPEPAPPAGDDQEEAKTTRRRRAKHADLGTDTSEE